MNMASPNFYKNLDTKAIFNWLCLIVFFNMSLSIIENKMMHVILGTPAIKTKKIVTEVGMYPIMHIVECKIDCCSYELFTGRSTSL